MAARLDDVEVVAGPDERDPTSPLRPGGLAAVRQEAVASAVGPDDPQPPVPLDDEPSPVG
jgi:hypothetical protein